MAYLVPSKYSSAAESIWQLSLYEINTYIPECKRVDISRTLISEHFRISARIRAALMENQIETWDDLFNISIQEILSRRILDPSSLRGLMAYACLLADLGEEDPISTQFYRDLLDSNVSNNLLIISQSSLESVHQLKESTIFQWTELEQEIFCKSFFGKLPPHKVASLLKIDGKEVVRIYTEKRTEFQNLRYIGEILTLLEGFEYQIISQKTLLSTFPELDIRLFRLYTNYTTLEVLVELRLIRAYGENLMDLSHGKIGKEILKESIGKLIPMANPESILTTLNGVEPSLRSEYLSLLGFRQNHKYMLNASLQPRNLLVQYLRLENKPINKKEMKIDLAGLIKAPDVDEMLLTAHGEIIPINAEDYALAEWGYDKFEGIQELIKREIVNSGPQHLDMLFASLDGYAISYSKMKKIASEPPFFLLGEFCHYEGD